MIYLVITLLAIVGVAFLVNAAQNKQISKIIPNGAKVKVTHWCHGVSEGVVEDMKVDDDGIWFVIRLNSGIKRWHKYSEIEVIESTKE